MIIFNETIDTILGILLVAYVLYRLFFKNLILKSGKRNSYAETVKEISGLYSPKALISCAVHTIKFPIDYCFFAICEDKLYIIDRNSIENYIAVSYDNIDWCYLIRKSGWHLSVKTRAQKRRYCTSFRKMYICFNDMGVKKLGLKSGEVEFDFWDYDDEFNTYALTSPDFFELIWQKVPKKKNHIEI